MSTILNIVNNSFEHPSADNIYKKTRIIIKSISLGTVYRNLNKLVELGMIKRIKMNDGIDRFDKINNKHNHFVCDKCHSIFDIKNNVNINNNIKNHKVISYEITFTGMCESCLEGEN